MKKVIGLLVVFMMVAGVALAIDEGNPRKGKYLYKKNCKSCHDAGGQGGDLTPMSNTMKQWDRYFSKKLDTHPGEVFKELSDDQKNDINKFLYDHAADSDQPATCG